jgi:hypothetical protein
LARPDLRPRILLAGSIAFLLDAFIPWNRACRVQCLSFSLWHGIGVAAGALAIVLAGWQALVMARPGMGSGKESRAAVLAGMILFFSLVKIAVDSAYLWVGAWLGLAVATVLALCGAAAFLPSRPGGPSGPERG